MGSITSKRVLFGHQSVGENIVNGLRAVCPEPVHRSWPIGAWQDVAHRAGGFFAHQRVGVNGDPQSKTGAFAELLHRRRAAGVDIALHKYCSRLFEYRVVLAQLRGDCPETTIVHVTVPLVCVATPWYRRLRRSDRPNLDADNAARESFNEQMRAAFAGQGTLFDLADVESTRPGHRPSAVEGPRSLDRHYTDDGGPLNKKGRARAAECLLRCLSDPSAPAAQA